MTDEEDEYEVEKIVDHVCVSGRKYYRVRWKNYTESGDTWEPYEHLLSCEDLLKEYIRVHDNNGNNKTQFSTDTYTNDDTTSDSEAESKSEKPNKQSKTKKSAQKKPAAKQNTKKKPTKTKPKPSNQEVSDGGSQDEPPKVKDPFWDDLEQGKINVFANDLYSKIKKRRKATAKTLTDTENESDKDNKHIEQSKSSKKATKSKTTNNKIKTKEKKEIAPKDDEPVDANKSKNKSQINQEKNKDENITKIKEEIEDNSSVDVEMDEKDHETKEKTAFQRLLEESEDGLSKKKKEKDKVKKEETTESTINENSTNKTRLKTKKISPPKEHEPVEDNDKIINDSKNSSKIQDADFLKTSIEKEKATIKNKSLSKKFRQKEDRNLSIFSKNKASDSTRKEREETGGSLFDKLTKEYTEEPKKDKINNNNYNKEPIKKIEHPRKPIVDMSEFLVMETKKIDLSPISLRDVEKHHQNPEPPCRLENDISNSEFRLHVRNNNFDMVYEALKSKRMTYNLEHTDSTWMTLLMVAAAAGHTEIVRVLCHHGARVNAKSKTGQTALMYAAEKGHELVIKVLILYGAYVNLATSSGETALMKAAKNGNGIVVRHLLQHGADPLAKSAHGMTAIELAESKSSNAIVELLRIHQNNLLQCVQSCVQSACNRLSLKIVGYPIVPLHIYNLRECAIVHIQFSSNMLGKLAPNTGLLLFAAHGMIGSNLSTKCRMRGPCFVNAVVLNNYVMDPVMPENIVSNNTKNEYNHFITNLVWKQGQNSLKLFLSQDASSNEKLYVIVCVASLDL